MGAVAEIIGSKETVEFEHWKSLLSTSGLIEYIENLHEDDFPEIFWLINEETSPSNYMYFDFYSLDWERKKLSNFVEEVNDMIDSKTLIFKEKQYKIEYAIMLNIINKEENDFIEELDASKIQVERMAAKNY